MAREQILQKLENEFSRSDLPDFRVGDTLRVSFKISEGDKERIQAFEGVLIAHRRGGCRASIRVRKISSGEGVERVFPLASKRVEKIEIMQAGHVRRAKLYYLRELKGKKARIKSRKEVQNNQAAKSTAK